MAAKHPGEADDSRTGLEPGAGFPEFHPALLGGKTDHEYLELPLDSRSLDTGLIKTPYLFVELFSEMCLVCRDEAAVYNKLFSLIERDGTMKGRLKMIGVGVGSPNRAVIRFRREKSIRFPLFADPHRNLHIRLGGPMLPTVYLLEGTGDGWIVLQMYSGHAGRAEALFNWIQSAID